MLVQVVVRVEPVQEHGSRAVMVGLSDRVDGESHTVDRSQFRIGDHHDHIGSRQLDQGDGIAVVRQAQVGIDLVDGYDAYLQINGVSIQTAEDGLLKDGTGLVQFQPGPDRPIESLNPGQNCVTAFVWDQLEGQATAEPVAWCFDAT